MDDFHFLRPWWLALLPVGAWLIWQLLRGRGDGGGWRSFVDAPLRGYVLAEPEVLRESRWPLVAALLAWTLALGALAGPAWERLPVPAFRSDEALVVALDLSRSMDAGDVEPTRLARAKLKLLDLLNRRTAGQTALVVFSTHAFTVTPLTTDTRTIASLVGSVTTDIMPTQGSSVRAGLEKAEMLLKQTGLNMGDVLLITDADVENDDLAAARDLRRAGFRVSVLAVGTEQGAPIGQGKGGFLTDENGTVVIPQLDPQALQRLALAGGGRFARLAPDDRDLDALFPPVTVLGVGTTTEASGEYQADVWRDRGSWLALALLPFLALAFRRGWICVLLLCFLVPVPRAEAFEWRDLWQRRDQQGYEAMQSEQAARAAELFKNPEWRGAAQYRAGKFADSATTLNGINTAEGQYNRGNALAKAGEVDEAIASYDRALELEPNHADAKYNRDLLAELKKKNEEQKKQQEQEQKDQDQQQSGDKKADGSNDDKKDEQDKQNEQARAEQQRGDQRSGQDPQQEQQNKDEEGQQDDADRQQQQAQNQEQQGQEPKPTPGPEEVEKWASEQAAEQWLRRVPQDPGGLLRRKFLYQYQRFGVDQEGKSVVGDGKSTKPW